MSNKLIDPRKFYVDAINESGGYFGAKSKNYSIFRNKYFTPFPDMKTMRQMAAFNHLIPGKIYTYNYDPLYADKLSFYDRRPIMISVKHFLAETTNNNIELGINLNFIPPKMKAIILQRLYNTYKSIIEKNMENMNKGNILSQRPLFVGTYDFMGVLDYLWNSVGNTAYKFALRNYIIDRMENVKAIDYEDWGRIIFVDSKDLCGASIGEIYTKYYAYKLGH